MIAIWKELIMHGIRVTLRGQSISSGRYGAGTHDYLWLSDATYGDISVGQIGSSNGLLLDGTSPLLSTFDILQLYITRQRAQHGNYNDETSARLWTHGWHPKRRPQGPTMGCLSPVRPGKMAAIYRVRTLPELMLTYGQRGHVGYS